MNYNIQKEIEAEPSPSASETSMMGSEVDGSAIFIWQGLGASEPHFRTSGKNFPEIN
jgi:hypothetical protein